MKIILMSLFIVIIYQEVISQNLQKPAISEIQTLPMWCQKMYEENPNVWEVDELYKNYYRVNLFVKNYHTQYYKRWKKRNVNNINEYGFISQNIPVLVENQHNFSRSTNWSLVGPIENFQEFGQQGSGQTNIYSIDQCKSNMNVLYCGTEPGEVYKSENGGANWFCVSLNENFGVGVTSVEVSPTNPNIVFAGGDLGVFRSINGGTTWENVLPNSNFGVNEILINSGDESIVFAATDKGLYRSTDGGNTWVQISNRKTYDIKEKTDDSSTLFSLRNNPSLAICEFYRSVDSGETWEIQTFGWYSSSANGRNDGGGRLAVTPADPNRIYAYLIGEAKANDAGFIGVFKSVNGGVSWTLPNTPTGGPYTPQHPNLAIGSPDWIYHQGFYNCAILCSETNPDEIIVGGLNIWKSTDGAATFQGISGYIGGPLNLHVDNQDFRVINGKYWFTTDGGIYHSTNLLETQPDFKMKGVNGAEFWGFGSGWNENILVGGLYHNGNIAHFDNYGQGNFLELGGGEAPTGYVNPGNNFKTYFSDISGKILPYNLNDPIASFGSGMSPNESYWAAESSEMEFHPNCYNVAFIGNENKLWKTNDGGASYQLLHSFGTNPNNQVKYIEISSENPNIIYLNQQPTSGNIGVLWKTIDGGQNWTSLSIPTGASRRMLLAINPENSNEIYMAYPDVFNGNKVFKSTNGGNTWSTYSDANLNGQNIQALTYIAGTNGGLYAGTNISVYYRNANNQWTLDKQNLPTYTNVNIFKPFYRDGKIRVATYGKGIWEGNLFENPSKPIARIMVNTLRQNAFCKIDSFYFDDYSFINHNGATWEWSFPTGSPSISNERNPKVYFSDAGNHLAILKITNQAGQTDSDTILVNLELVNPPSIIEEGFEGAFLPDAWQQGENNSGSWAVSQNIGAFGTSQKSAVFDNYNIYGEGDKSDLIVNINLPSIANAYINFDVAYARWGGANSDTLEVLYSNDCGENLTSLFIKGGTNLATSPDFQDFFEPNASQWRTEQLSLLNMEGNIQLIFRNIGRYGNALYIDNVNISNSLNVGNNMSESKFHVYPNPICTNSWLNVSNPNKEKYQIKLLDLNGKVIHKSVINSEGFTIPASILPGSYLLNVESPNTIWNKKIVVKD
jgi:photosystem II stability/assembly factor-like uncharacterized protein